MGDYKEYQRDYAEDHKPERRRRLRERYRRDREFREKMRTTMRSRYKQVRDQYPRVVGQVTLLSADVAETPLGLYFSTKAMCAKVGGCSRNFFLRFISQNVNVKDKWVVCVGVKKFYSEDCLDKIKQALELQGYRRFGG